MNRRQFLTSVSSGVAAALLTVLTLPVARWLTARISVNVKDYPFLAVGDGVTDDTAAIQMAIDSLSDGGVVYFPVGGFRSDMVNIPPGIRLLGAK